MKLAQALPHALADCARQGRSEARAAAAPSGEDARAALSPTLARFVAAVRRLSAPIPER